MEINATLLISAISFIAFIFIMNSLLYKPVLKIMEERENYISANKNEAELHKKNARGLLDDWMRRIADTQRKSRDIVSSKADAIKQEKAKVINEKKTEVTAKFNAHKDNLEQQKSEAIANSKGDVADLANNITTKLMGEGVAFEPLSEQEIEEVMNKHV